MSTYAQTAGFREGMTYAPFLADAGPRDIRRQAEASFDRLPGTLEWTRVRGQRMEFIDAFESVVRHGVNR